jgi:four helix bundle protein
MGEKIKSFEDLKCWQACRDVRNFIKKIIKNYPVHEQYGLIDGMRRSSRSITENIAEGFGRYHFQENIQFCRQSRGSLHELIDQLITSMDENYISRDQYLEGRKLIDKALGLINGYINYLNRAKENSLKKTIVKEGLSPSNI